MAQKTIEEKIKQLKEKLCLSPVPGNYVKKDSQVSDSVSETEKEIEDSSASVEKIEKIIKSCAESEDTIPKGVVTNESNVDYASLLKDFPGGAECLTDFIFSYIAGRQGDHWMLTEEEKKKYAVVCEGVAVKYFPKFLKWNLEISFIVMTGMKLAPRIKTDILNAKNKTAPSKKKDTIEEKIMSESVLSDEELEKKMKKDLAEKNG